MFNLLRKEAECSFCIHTVKKPKTLPCLHSFCLDCLNEFAVNRRQQGQTTFDCPVCLATFQLPDGDKFDAFPTAFYQNRLLDILALEYGDTEQQSCNNCEENVPAISFCFECRTFLCSSCLDAHSRLKVTQGHRRASLQNLQTDDVEELIHRPVLCEKQYHEKEPLEYYCEDCRVCICLRCGLVGHNKHSLLDIPHVAKQQKMQIAQVVEKMKFQVSECKQEMEKARQNFEAIQQRIKSARGKVQATVKEMMRVLKEHEAIVMKELDDLHQTQDKVYLAQQRNFELNLAQMNTSIEYAEAILKRNIGPEILQVQTAITRRCEELLRGENITANKLVNVDFVTNEQLYQTVRQSSLGQVVASVTDPTRSVAKGKGLQAAKRGDTAQFTVTTTDAEGEQCYSMCDQVTVLIQTPTREGVEAKIENSREGAYHVSYVPQKCGQYQVMIRVNGQPLTGSPWSIQVTPHHYEVVSSFGSGQLQCPTGVSVSSTGNIAVADAKNKVVQVFSSEGKYLKGFGQKRLKHPVAVAYATPEHLIVVDSPVGKNAALLFTENGTFLRNFSPVHLKDPSSVSVTNDGRVIVCERDGTVKVLCPEGGELLHSFATDCGTTPWHAVYRKEKFFVSYYGINCIKVFDVTGGYIHDIGGERTGDGQLQQPSGIAIDMVGNLLVVDQNMHSLQVFTPEGEFVYKIGGEGTEPGQFVCPEDIAVSRDGRVYIIDWQRVQIFKRT